jgi:hypothetical protein
MEKLQVRTSTASAYTTPNLACGVCCGAHWGTRVENLLHVPVPYPRAMRLPGFHRPGTFLIPFPLFSQAPYVLPKSTPPTLGLDDLVSKRRAPRVSPSAPAGTVTHHHPPHTTRHSPHTTHHTPHTTHHATHYTPHTTHHTPHTTRGHHAPHTTHHTPHTTRHTPLTHHTPCTRHTPQTSRPDCDPPSAATDLRTCPALIMASQTLNANTGSRRARTVAPHRTRRTPMNCCPPGLLPAPRVEGGSDICMLTDPALAPAYSVSETCPLVPHCLSRCLK